jgi:hypothetical protein
VTGVADVPAVLLAGEGDRSTVPSLASWLTTAVEIALRGPSTKTSGRLCRWIAARVCGGSTLRPAQSTGAPAFAAQPAAGIAYSGRSEGATTTLDEGVPAAAICRRSTPAASADGSASSMSLVL